jgi:hypothetical protein
MSMNLVRMGKHCYDNRIRITDYRDLFASFVCGVSTRRLYSVTTALNKRKAEMGRHGFFGRISHFPSSFYFCDLILTTPSLGNFFVAIDCF